MSGGGPPTNRLIQPNGGRLASESFFISSLSLRVCFCVIVQVIDARSNGNGANKMWHWSRRFVCVFLCVCMRVFLLMVQVPHEIRNVILDFGPTFFFARTNERVEKGKLECGTFPFFRDATCETACFTWTCLLV